MLLAAREACESCEADREAAALTVLRLCQVNFALLCRHGVFIVSK
jgi:hypothetical protein